VLEARLAVSYALAQARHSVEAKSARERLHKGHESDRKVLAIQQIQRKSDM